MTGVVDPTTDSLGDDPAADQQSLGTAAARTISTTTKTAPQARAITPRWLLRALPWVEVSGGTYRVNRRLSTVSGDGLVAFTGVGEDVRVVPGTLGELPPLRGLDHEETLLALAGRFRRRDVGVGETIVRRGDPMDEVFLIAHGKVNRLGAGKYGEDTVLGTQADGEHFGADGLDARADGAGRWPDTVRAVTACTLLSLRRAEFDALRDRSDELRAHLDERRRQARRAANKHGEAAIELSSGHAGEPALRGTYVDYDPAPREYPLSLAQTILRVHTRVADLYNEPMNQTEHQLRLTVEALRERQERELLVNPDFGLLPNVDPKQRIRTRTGPPTPEDLDELLCRRRKSQIFLAHPRAIAAFGRECTRRGIYPATVCRDDRPLMAWRGVPLLPCDKIPIRAGQITSILVMRLGEENDGVVGLRTTGLADEYEPGLSVRFCGIDERAVASYLVSAYYSAAVLVPNALGVLDDVQLGH